MARVWASGFEMGSTDFLDTNNVGSISTAQTPGVWSTYSYAGATNANFGQFRLLTVTNEYYIGFRLNPTSFGNNRIMGLLDAAGVSQCTLSMDSSGFLLAVRGANGATTIGTSTVPLSVSRWVYIECHIIIDDTVGVFEVKVDGVQVINFTGGDTKASTTTANATFMGLAGSNGLFMDDMYINDTTTSTNNGYSGDLAIKSYAVNAAGDVTGLSRGGADSGSNFGQVDERPANDATDYVGSTTVDLYDLYNIPDTVGIGSIQSVTLWLKAQKNDAGSASIAPMLKSGAVENTAADQPLSNSWAYYYKVYSIDPTDSGNWTSPKLDALQVGVKVR